MGPAMPAGRQPPARQGVFRVWDAFGQRVLQPLLSGGSPTKPSARPFVPIIPGIFAPDAARFQVLYSPCEPQMMMRHRPPSLVRNSATSDLKTLPMAWAGRRLASKGAVPRQLTSTKLRWVTPT